MAKDFKAGQVKTSKIIGKGGTSADDKKIVFYTDAEAGGSDVGANTVPLGGDDVSFVFSGEEGVKGGSDGGVTLFTGDIVVSGTLYAENQVIDLETTTDSGLTISGGTPLIAGSGTTEVAIHINTADEGAIMWDDGDALVYEALDVLHLESLGGIELNPAAGIVSIGADTRLDSTAGSTQYFNFGDTDGSSGYGIRSNAGAIEFKDNAGAWAGVGSGGGFDVEAEFGGTASVAASDTLVINGGHGIDTTLVPGTPAGTTEILASLDYSGTDNFVVTAPDAEGTSLTSSDKIIYSDAVSGNVARGLISDLPFADGEMTSFDLEDDIGNNTTITDGETLEVRGGPGLKTAVNTNRLDIEHDIDALTDIVTPDVNDYLIVADSTSTPSVTKRVKIGALPSGGGGGSPGGSAGDVQINDGSSGFDGAAHLKYDTTDNRVWLGSGTVPGTYNAKLHISSELIVPALPALPIDDAPTLRIDTKSGSPANDNESLLIDHAGTGTGTKIVKIDAKAAELFTIDNDGLINLTATLPKLVINSTGTNPNDEALIKLTDSTTGTVVGDIGSIIQAKQGDLLIANTEDSKIAQIVGKYGGASAQYYNIIRGEVGGVNKPTVMIQTDPFSLSGGATSAIGSNDINFYVEGTPASLGSTSVKGASKFAGDLKVVGCVSRGGILHLSNGPSGPQVYWIGGSGGHPHPDGVSTGTGPYSTAMEPTWVDSVIWNTTLVTDPLFYDLSPSKTDIKIKKAGTYKISYSVNLSQLLPATNRINMRTFLHQTTAPSTVTAIDCSEAWSYGRGVGSADTVSKMSNVCTTTKIFAENEEFNLNMVFLHGVRDTEVKVNVRSNQSWILIERIA